MPSCGDWDKETASPQSEVVAVRARARAGAPPENDQPGESAAPAEVNRLSQQVATYWRTRLDSEAANWQAIYCKAPHQSIGALLRRQHGHLSRRSALTADWGVLVSPLFGRHRPSPARRSNARDEKMRALELGVFVFIVRKKAFSRGLEMQGVALLLRRALNASQVCSQTLRRRAGAPVL